MENFPSLKKPSHLISTFFGVGLLPFAPGTWGSLAALLIFNLFAFFQLSFEAFTLILLLFTLISIITCEIATKDLIDRDQKSILIADKFKSKFKEHSVITTIQCGGNRRSEYNTVDKTSGTKWGFFEKNKRKHARIMRRLCW